VLFPLEITPGIIMKTLKEYYIHHRYFIFFAPSQKNVLHVSQQGKTKHCSQIWWQKMLWFRYAAQRLRGRHKRGERGEEMKGGKEEKKRRRGREEEEKRKRRISTNLIFG
jgi:hypothetical protein